MLRFLIDFAEDLAGLLGMTSPTHCACGKPKRPRDIDCDECQRDRQI